MQTINARERPSARRRRRDPVSPPETVRQPSAALLDDTVSIRGRSSPGLSVQKEANVILIAHPEQKMLGVRFLLTPGSQLEIGRSPSADFCLLDLPSVSRHHARLRYHGEAV